MQGPRLEHCMLPCRATPLCTSRATSIRRAMMRRLRSLSSHLRPDDGPPQRANASGAPPPDVLRAAVDRKFSDAQMKQFLTQGYMVIPIKDVEPDFHETIYQKCGATCRGLVCRGSLTMRR